MLRDLGGACDDLTSAAMNSPIPDPFAQPPQIKPVRPAAVSDGTLDIDRCWAEISKATVEGVEVSLLDCDELELAGSIFSDVTFVDAPGTEVRAQNCRFEKCDLSGMSFASLRNCTFTSCKLLGLSVASGQISDVLFDQCALRFVNLRMATIGKVAFDSCPIDDLDLFDASASDVSFDGCRVTKLNADRLTAERVDFRYAVELAFTQITRLDGCLISSTQLPILMHALAVATGLRVDMGES